MCPQDNDHLRARRSDPCVHGDGGDPIGIVQDTQPVFAGGTLIQNLPGTIVTAPIYDQHFKTLLNPILMRKGIQASPDMGRFIEAGNHHRSTRLVQHGGEDRQVKPGLQAGSWRHGEYRPRGKTRPPS